MSRLTTEILSGIVSDPRFWKKITIRSANECWLWHGAATKSGPKGYGVVRRGKLYLVHRVIYQATHGLIDDDVDVCHKCDVRRCANLRHLFPGSRKRNMEDAISKGRILRGESRWNTKLSDRDVYEIEEHLKTKLFHWKIAKMYGVSRTTVTRIGLGKQRRVK
jgi:HNH endonuclease